MTEDSILPPDQQFFKLNEVCKLANVQPYMLRFWGTEFEQLETTTTETGQRLYSKDQVELILLDEDAVGSQVLPFLPLTDPSNSNARPGAPNPAPNQ